MTDTEFITVGSSTDFDNTVLTDFGTSYTFKSWNSVYDNDTGEPDLTSSSYSTATTITGLLRRKGVDYPLNKPGMDERIDARFYCAASETIKKNDKIEFTDSTTHVYLVDSVLNRYGNFKRVELILWDK